MKVLVACEFSGVVKDAFLTKGHDAWSCDLLPSESPFNHLQQSVLPLLTPQHQWDLLIGFPPCRYLAAVGQHWNKRFPSRNKLTEEALLFFKALWEAPIGKICLENPPGIVASRLGIPVTQTIQPYQFGHNHQKRTCLRLKNLRPLRHTKYVPPPYVNRDASGEDNTSHTKDRARNRSRTYEGIAQAMADQWGEL